MSDRSAARLAHAELAAAEARARLGETLEEIQEKLSPANLLTETSKGLRNKGLELTDQVITTLRSRPVLATIAASGLGWLLSRKPALAMLLKLILNDGATSRAPAHSIASKPQRPRQPRERTRPARKPKETA
jgi:hypothetical protein